MIFRAFGAGDIDDVNRLVYRIENDMIVIAQCRTHYEKQGSGGCCLRAVRGGNRL
jgi:hypothetical protein